MRPTAIVDAFFGFPVVDMRASPGSNSLRNEAYDFQPFLFGGTFAPFFRAFESPMAIACFRLFAFPPLPLFWVPSLVL